MVSTLNLEEKFNRVRRNFCFYLDIQDHGLARSIARRIQDMGLQQEVFLTSRVTHVVASGAPAAACARAERRADAMLRRVRTQPPPQPAHYVRLTVQKAISLLDKLYDTFFAAPRKAHVRYFTKHFIKIEFLDKVCRPIYKEFDEWPVITLEPDPPKEKKDKEESPQCLLPKPNQSNTAGQKMTRKSRPRIKEREEKEQKGGYCEMCNAEYVDAASHRRSPHHAAFVRDHANFLALDSLISSGADVTSFLDKAAANGERRSMRNVCNGDRPDALLNGDRSPRRNGLLDDDRKHNTRCAKRNEQLSEDRQYYKVVGVSTKLRSSGGFAKRKDSPPACNGTKPLVVKFRKVRRSELSVLSDEAEQFMFPKRASSSSSTSSDEEEQEVLSPKRKSPAAPPPPQPVSERRRLARPLALKEESSEEDSWPEDKRRRKRRAPPVAKRGRRAPARAPTVEKQEENPPPPPEVPTSKEPAPKAQPEVSPLREEPVEKCMIWEDGKLKYTPAVEQLEFAFESVPASEPWFTTFTRQDQDRISVRNIPQYFELYSTAAPKLPYEIGQLPPLKPNCCPLSDLVMSKKEEKPGPSRLYGTRNMKRQRIKKRTAAILALEGHPRKSPREHASTLAILGSAGLLNRRKHVDDTKSTASEDTSDSHSNAKTEPVASETQEASERLQQFLSEVFEDAAEFDMSDETMEGDAAITTSTNVPDVSSLVSECEDCDLIRNELKAGATERGRGRRGKFKKKNRTGWPNKKKQTKSSRTNSLESEQKATSSMDRSSAEPMDDDTTQSTVSEEDANLSEHETTVVEAHAADDATLTADEIKTEEEKGVATDGDEDKVQLDLNVVVHDDKPKADKEEKRTSRSSLSDCEDKELRKKKRALQGLLLQPVVRVARVECGAARRLRSARARAAHS